jgi:hypothetical protein
MTNKEAIEMLKSKMDGKTDTSYEWVETVRLAINALEKITELENELEIKDKKNKFTAEMVEDILSHKDDPVLEEFRKNCIMINFLANQMQSEKPYYSILYYDKRNNTYYDGFGSCDRQIVNAYKEAYFERWDKGYFEKQIEELEDKHWEECRQIALYDDEVKQLKKELYGNCTMMKSSS